MTGFQGEAPSVRWVELRKDLDSCGYFPDLVEDTVVLAVGEETLLDFVVHHEPTFNHDEIRRHLTVLALTPTRLIVAHTDEQPADAERGNGGLQAATSSESVALSAINTVALTRVVDRPENYRRGDLAYEAWLAVSWGAMRRIDVEPAACADPQCEADHGLTGSLVPDDLTVRMSIAADGPHRVRRLVDFGVTLQRCTGRGTQSVLGSA